MTGLPSRFGTAALMLGAAMLGPVWAGNRTPATPPGDEAVQLLHWLARMDGGSKSRSYVGTFVVSSVDSLSSARIWHVCDGQDQVERVESLTGTPRTVFRDNDQVLTLWPGRGTARSERQEGLGLFPDRLRAADDSLARHYRLLANGQVERVAGLAAEKVQLLPRDKLRFGYRIWVEQQSGLVVKLQTLDDRGQVLEQSAFSELQLDAPLNAAQLRRLMGQLDGYTLEKVQPLKTTLADEGWTLKHNIHGFKALGCHKRAAHAPGSGAVHCVFSDGLASVSVFLEPAPGKVQSGPAILATGATHTLRTQVRQHAATLMGEVPPATLKRFAMGLERRKPSP